MIHLRETSDLIFLRFCDSMPVKVWAVLLWSTESRQVMASKDWYRFPTSIKKRLILSLMVVAAMAVASACLAWFSIVQSRARVGDVISETLPLVTTAQALSKDVAFFTFFAAEVPRISDEWEGRELLIELQDRITIIKQQLDRLELLGFEPRLVAKLQEDAENILQNLISQTSLAQEFIGYHQRLVSVVGSLQRRQQEFNEIAKIKVAEEHSLLLQKGHIVGNGLHDIIEERKILPATEHPSSSSTQDQSVFLLDSFLSVAVGALKANLELVAVTYRAGGVLQEAANVDKVERVRELQVQYAGIVSNMQNIKALLTTSNQANKLLLEKAAAVAFFGQGDGSIFKMREAELLLREQTADYTLSTRSLAEKLSASASQLADLSSTLAAEASSNLNRQMATAQYIQIIVAIIAIFVSAFIGWFFIGKRVIARIETLKDVMERQALGENVAIPASGGDELAGMADSLQKFVVQRARVEDDLRSAIDSLNEAKRIAQLGSFEHHLENGKWYWSNVFYEIIGYKEHELVSSEENFWTIVHPDDREQLKVFFRRRDELSKTAEIVTRFVRQNGDYCTVLIYLKTHHAVKTNTLVLRGTVQDVTERLRIEEELLLARKLDSIGVLAGGLAHDYNNIMTGILGNISLAIRLIGPDHTISEHLQLAEQATHRARELTEKLLTFAEGGEPIRAITSLPELLEGSIDFALSGSNVKCTMEVEENLWEVEMDPNQMQQAIQVLIINADQAMPDGGNLTVSCNNVEFNETNPLNIAGGHYVRIQVSDHGKGIAPEHLNKIFDPYFTTRERDSQRGRGLGLAIARSIVSKHQGLITVDTEPGQGTIFSVYIPAFKTKEGGAVIPAVAQQLGKPRVLVMDDDDTVRSVASLMLAHLGYDVVLAEDGERAIALYEKHEESGRHISVGIMDLTVPGGMGGKDAAACIISKYPEAKLVVSTGYSNDTVVENFASHGFCDVISKPYDMSEFADVLKRVVES